MNWPGVDRISLKRELSLGCNFFMRMLVEKQKGGIFAPTKPKRPVRLGVRTADFHSVNRGSIPLRATRKTLSES